VIFCSALLNKRKQPTTALARSRINTVCGDRYAKLWVQQAWRDLLGTYNEAGLYACQLYLEALAPFNRGLVELPDMPALVREFKSLQRVAGRSGKESVEHPRGGHDCLRIKRPLPTAHNIND
jgi:hypothetical protein